MIAILAALALVHVAAAALPTDCGVQVIKPNLDNVITPFDERVVGGKEAIQNSWPWQVQVRVNGGHYCGASIITNEWLLCAAHCVYGKAASQYSLRAGRHTSSGTGTADKYEQISAAKQLIYHESYTSSSLNNDVSLIRLTTPFTFNDYVSPVCLTDTEPAGGTNAWLTGWGNVEGTCCSGRLKQALLPIVGRTTCSSLAYWGSNITPGMVCAGWDDGTQGGCNGDSGGPLVIQNASGAFEQVGIVSWGHRTCDAPKKPTVFGNVDYYRTWITSKITEYETQEAQIKAKNFHPRLGAAFRAFAKALEE